MYNDYEHILDIIREHYPDEGWEDEVIRAINHEIDKNDASWKQTMQMLLLYMLCLVAVIVSLAFNLG